MRVVDFIETILNSLDFSIKVNTFTVVGTETELYVDNTYHARIGSIITIGANTYTVTTVVNNTTIIIEGTPANPTELTLATPNYFHGTATATNNELSKLDKDAKFPFVYCYELIRETYDNTIGSSIDRVADLRLYFLDNANFQDWSTEEHYDNVIDGMRNLTNLFIEKLNDHSSIGLFDTFELSNHVKFGVWTEKGHEKRVFNEYLSGVELLINLPLKKNFDC